jgi:hypothetical protein
VNAVGSDLTPRPPLHFGEGGKDSRALPPPLRFGEGAGGWGLFAFLFALAVLPLIAHGCHGDDVDHEPLVAPPAVVQHTS